MLRDPTKFASPAETRLKREEDRIREAYANRTSERKAYSWSNRGHVFVSQERERLMIRALRENNMLPLAGRQILEVGCGNGSRLRDFVKWGARPGRVFGVELLEESADEARERCPPDVTIECRNAEHLPYRSRSFDIVLQATVFSSIIDPLLRKKIAQEMLRVLKPTGMILWYDVRVQNPWNRDVRGVNRGEIEKLFEGCAISLRSVCLAAPLTRWLAERSWIATYLLSSIPQLCTHYMGVIHPARASSSRQPLNLRA